MPADVLGPDPDVAALDIGMPARQLACRLLKIAFIGSSTAPERTSAGRAGEAMR
jgi:hypothetical protein